MMNQLEENEVKFKILQALNLTGGQLTSGMLQAHLTSRVTGAVRDAVLMKMLEQGTVKLVDMREPSFRGRMVLYTVIKKNTTDNI